MDKIKQIVFYGGLGIALAILNVSFWPAIIILIASGFVYEFLIENQVPPAPSTCPQCANLESIKTTKNLTFADQVYRDLQREDRHYYSDGKFSGSTFRYEQAKVPLIKWDEIASCEHCGYQYSVQNRELVGSPNADINEMKNRYGFLKSIE